MADPLTLTAVGAVVLTEGIKFLYQLAGEVLKRWRERKNAGKSATVEPADVELPSNAFDGQLERPQVNLEAVQRLEQDLRDLRAAVADYAQGIDTVNPRNEQLLQTADALRHAMEAVYGQRITFHGEPRPPSGPSAVGEANVDEVLGYVAGLRASKIVGGSATGRVTAKRVEAGGQAVGLDVGTLGREDRFEDRRSPSQDDGADKGGTGPADT
jgi:hypothetical protein